MLTAAFLQLAGLTGKVIRSKYPSYEKMILVQPDWKAFSRAANIRAEGYPGMVARGWELSSTMKR